MESWVDISKNDCECTSREKCTGTTTTSSGAQSPSHTWGSIHDCQHHGTRLRQTHNYTVSQKNVPPLACYNFWHTRMDFDFFGRNVTDKVGNQKTLYYATSNNLCFCTTWQNWETRKSHISLNWIVLHAQCTCALSSWKKKLSSVMCLIASNICWDSKISH